jgi:tetratricopeptide (TPR) repeat protein
MAQSSIVRLARTTAVAVFASFAVAGGAAVAQEGGGEAACGSLQNHYGPFDYRTSTPQLRSTVEPFHLTPKVMLLREGQTGTLGHDIGYTLRAFPNHPKALLALSRLALREKRSMLAGAIYTIECFFDRAIRFAPDDPMVRMLWGMHLARSGSPKQAKEALDKASELGSPNDADLQYNLGLGYLEISEWELARKSAKLAYENGFPLPGLRDRLRRAGQWQD